MGSSETAITLIGGPRVSSVFDVHGCQRAQIKHFFGMREGSRTRYGVGLMVGSHLRRMRMNSGHPIALKALDQRHWQIMLEGVGPLRELVDLTQGPAYAV